MNFRANNITEFYNLEATIVAANLDDFERQGATKTQPTTNEPTALGLTGGLEESQENPTGEGKVINPLFPIWDASEFSTLHLR